MRKISILALASLAFCACGKPTTSSGRPASTIASASATISSLGASVDAIDATSATAADSGSADASANETRFTGKDSQSFLIQSGTANAVRDALVARDMHRFAGFVHPTRGVRFSPYAYVDTKADVVLHANEIESAFASKQTRNWGSFDGSGDPILMTFRAYLARFVAFSELAKLQPRLDGSTAFGNTTNNQREAYGDAHFVEYYSPGKNGGTDWEALRIVFDPVDGKLYVVGIIHDVWTISKKPTQHTLLRFDDSAHERRPSNARRLVSSHGHESCEEPCMRSALLPLFFSCVLVATSARAETDDSRKPTPAEERTSKVLGVTGALTFGLAYLPMLAMSIYSFGDSLAHFQLFCGDDCQKNDATVLVYPFAGPFLYARPHATDHAFGTPSPAGRAALYADGTAQITGALTLVALGIYRVVITHDGPLVSDSTSRVSIEPSIAPNNVSMGATIRF